MESNATCNSTLIHTWKQHQHHWWALKHLWQATELQLQSWTMSWNLFQISAKLRAALDSDDYGYYSGCSFQQTIVFPLSHCHHSLFGFIVVTRILIVAHLSVTSVPFTTLLHVTPLVEFVWESVSIWAPGCGESLLNLFLSVWLKEEWMENKAVWAGNKALNSKHSVFVQTR